MSEEARQRFGQWLDQRRALAGVDVDEMLSAWEISKQRWEHIRSGRCPPPGFAAYRYDRMAALLDLDKLDLEQKADEARRVFYKAPPGVFTHTAGDVTR